MIVGLGSGILPESALGVESILRTRVRRVARRWACSGAVCGRAQQGSASRVCADGALVEKSGQTFVVAPGALAGIHVLLGPFSFDSDYLQQ